MNCLVTILTKLKVRDFEPWLETFQKYADKRADFGCKSETVYRPQRDAPSVEVYVMVEWSSEKAFEDYMGWLRPQAIAGNAGVLASPEHVVLGERAA